MTVCYREREREGHKHEKLHDLISRRSDFLYLLIFVHF